MILKDFNFYFKMNGLTGALFNLGMWSLLSYRIGNFLNNKLFFKFTLVWYVYVILNNLLVMISKIEISITSTIGKQFNFVHAYGVVIGNNVVIGDNCTIGPWVVIGHNGDISKQPHIGDNVYLAPHCCILGDVKIGNNVIIGANSVITKNIPSNSIVKCSDSILSTKNLRKNDFFNLNL